MYDKDITSIDYGIDIEYDLDDEDRYNSYSNNTNNNDPFSIYSDIYGNDDD